MTRGGPMRTRRPRGWRLRTLLVAVAGLAAMLGWARFEWAKPRPIAAFSTSDGLILVWSDDKRPERERGSHPVDIQSGSLLTLVKWSDGVTTYSLHWPDH